MTDMKKLLAQATPLPWGNPSEYQYGDFGWYIPGSPLGEVADTDQALTDLTLATHAVNRLPDYEAAVDALATLIERYHNEPVRPNSSPEYNMWMNEQWSPAMREAREALRRLRGAA